MRGCFFFLVFFLNFSLCQSLEFPERTFDVTHYNLNLTIPFEKSGDFISENRLKGLAKITLRNSGKTAMEMVPVILHRLMKVNEISLENGTGLSFSQQIRPFEGNDLYQINFIEIRLENSVPPGEEVTFEVSYEGALYGYQETGMLYVREALDPEFTIIRFETYSYPQILNPVDFERRPSWNDSFSQVLRITVPEGHTVANAGNLVGVTTTEGLSTFEFRTTEPKSMIILPIAKYGVINSGKNSFYFFPEDEEGAQIMAAATEKAMALMADWFGPLQKDQGLKVIEIPEWYGSQVDFPAIIQTSDAFKDQSQMGQLYHELSHFWNPPDPTLRPARWNEGLAMFLQGLTSEKLDKKGALRLLLERLFERAKTATTEKEYQVPMKDYGQHDVTFLSYRVGAVFFGLLYYELGEERFLHVIRRFNEIFAAGATTEEFIEYLINLDNPTVAKLVEDWFQSVRYVEILTAAKTFNDILAFYGIIL